jgi:glutamate synthase domain-containing protein 1
MRSLYELNNSTRERDACGIGFIADVHGQPSRRILDLILSALGRVKHRGAINSDGLTGDGAGVLLPLTPRLAPEGGLAMVFAREEGDLALVEQACAAEKIGFAGWREVPVDPSHLGERGQRTQPTIMQAQLAPPKGLGDNEVELAAFRARKRVEREQASLYIASLSFRTVTYKALCAADQLACFYPDLADPELEIPFGIFHQRFATNTTPTWERAQPFRMLCHNGEINAVAGNVNWMHAREHHLGSANDASLYPAIEDPTADSRTLDNVLELLVRGGRDVRHALAMLVPEAWDGNPELDDRVRDFYRYHSCLLEPWDGPAGIIFTDGRMVGAGLDRNGLRPLRYLVSSDGLAVCASEIGLVDLPEGVTAEYGMLGPGQMIAVDPARGELLARALRSLAARGNQDRLHRQASRLPVPELDSAPGGLRLHPRGSGHHPAPDGGHRPRAHLLDGRRCRDHSAGEPRPTASDVLQAALRPGHQPADRLVARAHRLQPQDPTRRSGPAPHRGARGGMFDRAGQLLPLSRRSDRARMYASRCHLHEGRGTGGRLRAACRRGL